LPGPPRGRDRDVDAAEPFRGALDELVHLGALGHVGRDGKRPLAELLRELLEPFGPARGQRHAEAVLEQRPGDGQADPARGAGDERGRHGRKIPRLITLRCSGDDTARLGGSSDAPARCHPEERSGIPFGAEVRPGKPPP
jgi:hypothetical protein